MAYYADRMYIHARIMALQSQLLRRQDYADLVQSGNFHAHAPDFTGPPDSKNYIRLKETVYKNQIKKLSSIAGSSKAYVPLFRSFFFLYELPNIKLALLAAQGESRNIFQWLNFSPFHFIEKDAVTGDADRESLETMIQGLPGMSERELPETPEEREALIDFIAMQNILSALAPFSREDRTIASTLIALRCATYRESWSLRLRSFYGWSDEEVNGFLETEESLEGLKKLRTPLLDRARHEARRELRALDPKKESSPAETIPEMERALELLFYRKVRKTLRYGFHTIAPVIAYLWLLGFQLRNLFTIIEGIRFKVPGEKITSFLLCED